MGALCIRWQLALVVALLAVAIPPTAPGQTETGLDVQTAGHGEPPLIFLSAPGAPTTGWDHVVARFEVAYRCHVVTLAADRKSPEDQADALAVYAHAQDLVHPVVVGQGAGGAVAVALAVRAPTLPGRLVLVDCSLAPDSRLEAIRCPTLVLAAAGKAVRRRYHDLPGVRFVFSGRAEHDFVAEDLDGFTDALRRALTSR